ncbi:MAG: hypothetical protein DRJ15_16435 [Bacteroidetes bacterium]|nr:MAG: hypothetical protein DRJ15_16435 [Bacteroidota bacterium]
MKKLSLLILSMMITFFLAGQTAGTLDLSFGNNGITLTDYSYNGVDNYSYASALQADGKIILGGYSVNNLHQNMTFVRYLPDGTLDNTFGDGGIKILLFGGSDDRLEDLVIQADGKIIAVGYTSNSTNKQMTVTRLNTDGSLDNSFNANGMTLINFGDSVNAYGRSVALQDDGKIIVGGHITFTDQDPEINGAICRLTSSGVLDNTFGVDGIITHDILSLWNDMTQIAIQDEKIILGGISTRSDDFARFITLCRYNPDGSLDTGFGTSGIMSLEIAAGTPGYYESMCLTEDGKIIFANSISTGWLEHDLAVWRFQSNGFPDNSFGYYGMVTIAMGANSDANAVALQADGKIVAAGFYTNPSSGKDDFLLVRYHENGYLDLSFGTEGTGVVVTNASSEIWLSDQIFSLLIQDDGKLLVSGYAYAESYNVDFAVARYYSGLNIGVETPEQDTRELTIFPNPITEETKLVINLAEESIVKVEVFNAFGTKVTELTQHSYSEGEHQFRWDGGDVKAGVYIIKMTVGDMVYTSKVVKAD